MLQRAGWALRGGAVIFRQERALSPLRLERDLVLLLQLLPEEPHLSVAGYGDGDLRRGGRRGDQRSQRGDRIHGYRKGAGGRAGVRGGPVVEIVVTHIARGQAHGSGKEKHQQQRVPRLALLARADAGHSEERGEENGVDGQSAGQTAAGSGGIFNSADGARVWICIVL